MPKAPDNLTPEAWHRFYAAQANNQAWDLSESVDGTVPPGELLDAAHAAAWHWQQVGTELNKMRSLMLLSLAHARAKLGPSAWHYAQTMQAFFLAKADTPDWEVAFVHTVHALAAQAHGDAAAFDASRALAKAAIDAIQSEVDRAIVLKTYRLIETA